MTTNVPSLLERLGQGVVVGDGGFVFALEKRGYVKAGCWTPEVTVEHPESVRQLHREFLRAGADVMQAFSFYGTDDKLENFGCTAKAQYSGMAINQAACRIAREVADEGGALVAGCLSQTPSYLSGKSKDVVQGEFRRQLDVFVQEGVDFLICEYFEHIEEMEWVIEAGKTTGKTVCASMCLGSDGDMHGVSAGDCGVRMAKAGADVVGMNCQFGPNECLSTMAKIKAGLDKAGLSPYLIVQPLGYHTPDAGNQGHIELVEFPFALEPRTVTRWEMRAWARQMYSIGVRYIGGCCGTEPYHIRAIAEELVDEHGGVLPRASEKHDQDASGLRQHTKPWVRARGRPEYWQNINPASGRPYAPALSTPEHWGVTQGDAEFLQQTDHLSEEQLAELVVKHRASSKNES